jgi:hypothetical protein
LAEKSPNCLPRSGFASAAEAKLAAKNDAIRIALAAITGIVEIETVRLWTVV